MTRAWLAGIAACVVALAAPAARAHVRSVSYSTWLELEGRVVAIARVSRLDASVLERAGADRASGALTRRIRDAFTLRAASGECRPSPEREREAGPEWVELEWELGCEGAPPVELEVRLLFAENPTHLHLATLRRGGEAPVTRAFDVASRTAELGAGRAEGSGVRRFFRLGVEHLLSGWDHLAFVALLLVGAASIRSAAWAVSGFTVGHALTLSLAALGVVVPHEAPVEALIAASLGLVAVENTWRAGAVGRVVAPAGAVAALAALSIVAAWRGREAALALTGAALFAACWFPLLARSSRPERLRGGVAALFGLVHGFGFARVLAGLELPAERVAGALLGFNLGVELGQLAVVAVSWPLLAWVRRRWPPEAVAVASSTVALALAAYWAVTRTFG